MQGDPAAAQGDFRRAVRVLAPEIIVQGLLGELDDQTALAHAHRLFRGGMIMQVMQLQVQRLQLDLMASPHVRTIDIDPADSPRDERGIGGPADPDLVSLRRPDQVL